MAAGGDWRPTERPLPARFAYDSGTANVSDNDSIIIFAMEPGMETLSEIAFLRGTESRYRLESPSGKRFHFCHHQGQAAPTLTASVLEGCQYMRHILTNFLDGISAFHDEERWQFQAGDACSHPEILCGIQFELRNRIAGIGIHAQRHDEHVWSIGLNALACQTEGIKPGFDTAAGRQRIILVETVAFTRAGFVRVAKIKGIFCPWIAMNRLEEHIRPVIED
jgi:hypothetical protein